MKYLVLILFLQGCAVFQKQPEPNFQNQKVYIEKEILEECKPLENLQEASFKALLTITTKNAEIYADCSRRQKAAVKLLKEVTNNE